jgi:hypothetical protein
MELWIFTLVRVHSDDRGARFGATRAKMASTGPSREDRLLTILS